MSIVLSSTTDTLKGTMGGSPSVNPTCVTTWTDKTSSGVTPGRSVVTAVTNTTLVAAPASSTQRVIDTVCIANNDAAAVPFEPFLDDNSTPYSFGEFTIQPGEQLVYAQGKWSVLPNVGDTISFMAYAGAGTVTTNGGNTKILFSTESWDVGSYFSGSTYTPPEGKYLLTSTVNYTTAWNDGKRPAIYIYKNGALHARGHVEGTGFVNVVPTLSVTAIVESNGTDYWDVYIYNGDSGNRTTDTGLDCFFAGVKI